MSLYQPEDHESTDEAELLDDERKVSIDPDSKSLSQDELAEWGRRQSERGDGTLNHPADVDRRRKATEEDERTGGKKKQPTLKEQKENLVFFTDFGEKILLSLPGFDVDTREMTEEGVSETERDGDDLSGSGTSSREDGHLSEGGSNAAPEIFEREEREQTESPGASRRSYTQKNPASQSPPEESACERLEVQMTEEMERLKAKAQKKCDGEKRRQQLHQDSAKEELKRELMEPRWSRTSPSGNQCRSEVDGLEAQEVEQLKPQMDLELRAEAKKVTEGLEEREQLWRLYQDEIRLSVKLDYEEKLEKLRAEHWTELNSVQQECRKEAWAQRESLVAALQEEKERLQASHAQHLERLRLGFERQKQQLQLEHSRKMSEVQRREEQLELRAEELRDTEDTRRRMQDKQEDITKASEKLREESDELRRELQKVTAQTQEARELLQKTQAERDEARSDEELLKVERDKAVQMCAAAVEQRERLKTTYEKLEKRYSREKRGLSSTLDRRKASSSEASDSSSLMDDTGGAADDVHEGCRWKTTSTAQHGGDRRRDTEQAEKGKNQRKELEETEEELQEQMEALNNLKRDRDQLKKELQDMIEEKTKESMDMALVKTEVLMRERDRVMMQRIREEKEELEKKLEGLQRRCSLFSHSRRGKEQNKGFHRLFWHDRTAEEEARDADSSSISPEPDSAEEEEEEVEEFLNPRRSCCFMSNRIHSQFPNLERGGAGVLKTGPLGLASSPRVRDRGPGEPGHGRRARLLQGTARQLLPVAAVKPTHSLRASPSRVERLVKSSRRWLQMHGKDAAAPPWTRPGTLNNSSFL